ncbi:unnamed protein product [Malus baccata var. baccata]
MTVAQNAQPRARPVFRITYQKPYPEYIDELNPFPLNFKMPAFPIFTGEDSSVSSRDHIFKLSNHCVAYEDNPNYKLRLFGNSLAGLVSQWYSLLPSNSIANWGQMEMAFHEQFYKIEPELTINDLVEVKQYDHESTEDFMMRALKLPLRKRFYDAQFNELQELVIAATKYERLLQEEQQVKHTSKVPHFYKNKAVIHRVEVGETRDWVQDLIVKGKLLLDSPQASMMVDTNPFPEAPINMINLILKEPGSPVGIAEKGKIPGYPNTLV